MFAFETKSSSSPDAHKGRRMLFVALRIAILVYLGLLLLLVLFQTTLIFPATRGITGSPRLRGWDYEEVRLPVNGHTTCGWFLPVDNPRGTVLFSHGNGGNLDLWYEAMDVYRALGFNVLVYDYGGYGHSTGRPSERRCYDDARAMWNWLTRERGVPPDRIVLIGRSLGSAVAAQIATEVTPGALVLESPFRSVRLLARRSFPFLPVGLFLRHKFDTEAKIAGVHVPTLFVHSRDDTLVPLAHGQHLYNLANPPKDFLTLDYGGHNDAFYLSEEAYTEGLAAFLDPLFPAP
jgi:fermentation-respiration switch protein FrsA (DUF1100 family)